MFKLAILGAGNIARAMAATVRGMAARGQQICLYAVGSRDLEKAHAFAAAEGVQKAYGSYEALCADPDVDLVYIATPHSHHAEHIRLCVEHGRPVLCEKAFTGNARQAREVLALAEEKGVFVTEAIWTRYQPARELIRQLITGGEIGEVKLLQANLGYPSEHVQRMTDPALAGGALLDLGVYPLNFALMVLGDEVCRMESSAELLPTGVDRQSSITLHYPDGVMAQLMCSMSLRSDRHGIVYGDKGMLVVDNINNPQRIDVLHNRPDGDPALVRSIQVPQQITGYEYQVEASMNALAAGLLQCEEMPHAETIRVMEMMDSLRASWGVRYPFD